MKHPAPAIIECVPNFSEGRDPRTIAALAAAASRSPGAALLDLTSDPDHNRTVLTLAGDPEGVADAAFRAVRVASELIHLPAHRGVHPRIGAADVVPFVPVSGLSLGACADIARRTGRRIWETLRIPVFLYEASATAPHRAPLETIRSRAFTEDPDFGVGRHETAGAVVVGARPFLIAWNVNLLSRDLDTARKIARAVRQSSGGLPFVKALGLELKSRAQVQVSVNLTNFECTPLHIVFHRIEEEAHARGIAVEGSELIGLIPRRALELSAGHDLHWLVGERIEDYVLETRLLAASQAAKL